MKKIILILALIFTFLSCSKFRTPEENLLAEAEAELKLNMNDPSSYEFVSFEIDDLKKIKDQEEIKKLNMEEFNMNNDFYLLTYRGKNKMGALILDEIYVKTDKDMFFLGLEDKE